MFPRDTCADRVFAAEKASEVILMAVPRHVRHLDIGASRQGAQILPAAKVFEQANVT